MSQTDIQYTFKTIINLKLLHSYTICLSLLLHFTTYYILFQTGGFFIEAGAVDGEAASNSYFFEVQRNWTGLLVEPDPIAYNLLKTKHRKAYSVNSCLDSSVKKVKCLKARVQYNILRYSMYQHLVVLVAFKMCQAVHSSIRSQRTPRRKDGSKHLRISGAGNIAPQILTHFQFFSKIQSNKTN